jgi:anti-sigma regulatory factor (Ser/Thr protein kinase)
MQYRSSRTFPDQLGSARHARRFVRDTLELWGCSEFVDSAVLVVSEIFTNAVLHGSGDPEVVLLLHADRVEVQVHDAEISPPVKRTARPEDLSGRGLGIVDSLCDTWGSVPLVRGKCVWCSLDRR